MEHQCLHENDFGTIFERISEMKGSFDDQRTAVSGLLKYMWEKEAVDANHAKKRLTSRQRLAIIVTVIIGFFGIIISLLNFLK